MKRFYALVSTQKEQNGYSIRLDGKPVKAPSGSILNIPTSALADAVVLEWAAQVEEIKPDAMPLTQMANTAQDRVSRERPAMQAAILKYLDTDLLCYRINDHQTDLMAAQAAAWDPWLSWFEEKFGSALETTTVLAALKQPEAAHKAVAEYVAALDDQRFTAFQIVVPLCGSIVLALAFAEGAITPEQLFTCAKVDEDHKARIYNEDVHGRAPLEEKKNAAMLRDLEAAARYLELL